MKRYGVVRATKLTAMLIVLCSGGAESVLGAGSSAQEARDYWAERWKAYSTSTLYFSTLNSESSPRYDWRYADRVKLSAGINEYMSTLASTGVLMSEMDLQDYVQRVLLSVYPDALPEGHPGALRVRIAQSPVPNAVALSDGTIVVNVGLLTLLRSEDELAAVLAHEVGHVVLDHNMERYLAAKSRAGMATFLGAVAGITAGVLSAGSSDPSIRYAAGEIAVGAFVLGTALSAGALELVGAKFSREQEIAADRAAQGFLRAAQRDTLAMASVLERLRDYGELHGERDQASLADDHPSIEKRLSLLPKVPSLSVASESSYEGGIAVALDQQARLLFHEGRYRECSRFCDRLVAANWATGATLVLKASAVRLASLESEVLQQAATWLDQAEHQYGYTEADVHVERAMIRMRLGNEAGAIAALQAAENNLVAIGAERMSPNQSYLLRWTRSMGSRLKGRMK